MTDADGEAARSSGKPPTPLAARIMRFALPVLILLLGAGAAQYLLRTGPSAERRPVQAQARLVDVERARWTTRPAAIEALGVVVPARRVDVRPEVTGIVRVVSEALEPGGLVAMGDALLEIDARDYELAIEQRRAELAEADAALRLEMGHQVVARRELELLGDEIVGQERSLVLREPHLQTARARVDRARAALVAAELDRERTVVRAPFDAIVEERIAAPGLRVDSASVVATLVARDQYWVEVALPQTDLRWLQIGDRDAAGSRARVWLDGNGGAAYREGSVVRLRAELEPEGKLAQVLISITDPLAPLNGGDSLLLGAVVTVAIEGVQVEGVPLDRRYLRDGSWVWVMAGDDTLEIRRVEVGFRSRTEVFVTTGLADGDRIVTTDLAAPVTGMALRVARDQSDG